MKKKWKTISTKSYHFHHQITLQALKWHLEVLVHAPAHLKSTRYPCAINTWVLRINAIGKLSVTNLQHFLCLLKLKRIWMAGAKNPLHLTTFTSQWINAQWKIYRWGLLTNAALTSLISVSVWSNWISSDPFFPMPFCDIGKSFLDWALVNPLPLPAPGALSCPAGLLMTWPDPP